MAATKSLPCDSVWWETAAYRGAFRRALRRWFERSGRDLPWRHERTLYRVWVSEIMLQQTQAATVSTYYHRFLEAFPDVQSLAAASEAEVLRLWEGLGYYRRARNLHAAAKRLIAESRGAIPCTISGLTALPGIGRYTAGAILSFALDEPHPVLEANTRRLYGRLMGLTAAERSSQGHRPDRALWEFAERLLPRRGAAAWNDALMDLGSLVCTPHAPKCGECPVRRFCLAQARGSVCDTQHSRSATPATRITQIAVVVFSRCGKLLMKQRSESEWWSGLWDFVRLGNDGQSVSESLSLERAVATETGVPIHQLDRLPTIRHSVTRYRITLDCYRADCSALGADTRNGYVWVDPAQIDELPLTRPARRLANRVVPPAKAPRAAKSASAPR